MNLLELTIIGSLFKRAFYLPKTSEVKIKMHIYYVAGVPYSDDLYHSGTKGMKWGRRLYQYEDGTLTPLGKLHYAALRGAKVTGKAIGTATKKVAKYEVEKFKRNHPWMMSNSELDETLKRAKTIEAISASRQAARGRTFKGKLGNAGWTLVDKFAGTMGDNLGKKLGEGAAQKILQGSDKREAEKIRGEIELENAKKGQREEMFKIRKANDRLDKEEREYNRSKREEQRKERGAKSGKTKASNRSSSSDSKQKKKTVSATASVKKGKAYISGDSGIKTTATSLSKAGSSARATEGSKWVKKTLASYTSRDYNFYDQYFR